MGLSFNDYIFLVHLYIYKKPIKIKKYKYDNLLDKNFIKINTEDNTIILRQTAINLLEYLRIDTFGTYRERKVLRKSKQQIQLEVEGRINEYREKWRGLKAGSMGGKKDCIQKLVRWMINNPDYTFDEILKAADLYLSTEGKAITFLQRADFFIYKQDIHKNEASRLSAYIDELEMAEPDDWTSKLV